MRIICHHVFLMLVLVFQLSSCTSKTWPGQRPLVISQNEKVIFLGNAFFENAVAYGEIETTLALRHPYRNITFRNIGWSGDNVYAHARTRARDGQRFGAPEEGFGILAQQISDLKPDKIFIAYGFNESFDKGAGIESYRKGLERRLKMLNKHCPELILISTLPMEEGFGIPTDHIVAQNRELKKYAETTKEVAVKGEHRFIDLFTPFSQRNKYTTNGVHLSSEGYRKAGDLIAEALSFPQLSIKVVSKEADLIRNTIIKKNTLFFQRWRPQNDAYVYGLRKDEQRVAQEEPAQIEPFIEKQEVLITSLLREL